MKTKKKKLNKDQKRIIKWLRVIICLCVAIIFLEVLFICITYYNKQKNIVYKDVLNSFTEVDDGYISSGNSDFKRSRYVSYQKEFNKAKIAKYDEDFNLVFESAYKKGYLSSFNYATSYKDGYIAVGNVQKSKQQITDQASDGLIVLYDEDGDIIKSKTVQIAGDTNFTKVLVLDDGFLVIGQSILENMTLGVDPKAGALMIKYDFSLKEQWKTNYGGSKSAIYNDVLIDGDYIYLVGKDATRYGIISKYSLDGEMIFSKSYEYTDLVGFTSIVKNGDNFFVSGAKTINIDAKDQDKETKGLILKYNSDGEVLDEVLFEKNKQVRFNKIVNDGNSLLVIGSTYLKNEKKSTKTYNYFDYSAIIIKYDKDLKKIKSIEEKGSRDTYFNDIYVLDDGYVLGGTTSSKEYGSNNKDYIPYFIKYNKKLKQEWIK